MSRDASGTYTAPTNSFNPAVEGTAIDESDWNTTLQDIEDGLTDSLSVSGKGKITAHIDFDETTVSSPSANVGRLYVKDVGGVTSLFFKDSGGNDTNMLLSSPGLAYTFSTSTTTTSDPGAGIIRFNNATISSVTEIAVDDLDANGADLSAFVLTWDDQSGSNRGKLIIQNRTAPANVAIFLISGGSTDESGWTRMAVTYVTHAGSFGSNAPLGVTYSPAGAPGDAGAPGSAGATGVAGNAIRWLFDSSTSMADPGSGDIRLNNATLSSVTAAAVSDLCGESGNPDVSAFVLAWDDSTTTSLRGFLIIKKESAPQNFAVYSISGASTDNTGWTQLALTYVTHSGSFSNADTLVVSFSRSGDKGSDGAGTGDVVGPGSATDNAIVRYDGTTGKLVQNSAVTIDDTTGKLTGARFGNTGLSVEDTNASHLLTFIPGSDLSANRTLTVVTGDADRTLTISGNATVSQDYSSTGSPTFANPVVTTVEVGNPDTTVSRHSAGIIAVEGVPLYSQIPQNSQSTAYTLVLADAQKHILHPTADNNARTFTIPANSSVAYPIGTCLTFVNQINTVTIAITTDTMTLAGVGTTGSRTLAANGMATALKIASTSWIISGAGLT